MRVALVSPLFESVPPQKYGGTERVVAYLCDGLQELGCEVTLFASADSEVSCELVAGSPTALRSTNMSPHDQIQCHLAMMSDLARRVGDFDVIHSHIETMILPVAELSDTPVVATMHGRLDLPWAIKMLRAANNLSMVSISDYQRLPIADGNWIRTIYHGLPIENYKFYSKPGSYLCFLGRIAPEKRPDLAIKIARDSGVPLKIAAKVDPVDRDYYEAEIKPLIDGRFIEFIGEIADHEKSEFLGNALGMVFPIDWPEPFGLAPVEAMACGTPVLSRPFGSVPEIQIDGYTGFVHLQPEALAASVDKLVNMDRLLIRQYVEQNFSLARMCEEYVDVYQRLIDQDEVSNALQHHQSYADRRYLLYTN